MVCARKSQVRIDDKRGVLVSLTLKAARLDQGVVLAPNVITTRVSN